MLLNPLARSFREHGADSPLALSAGADLSRGRAHQGCEVCGPDGHDAEPAFPGGICHLASTIREFTAKLVFGCM